MSVGSQIRAVDYNTIRSKIINVMSSGAGQTGYGQSIKSTDVTTGNEVTKEQWDLLRFDILNARVHQDGVTPTIVSALKGQPIRFGADSPNNQYNTQTDIAVTNRFNLGLGQFVVETAWNGISSISPITRTTSWKTSISSTVTVTFSTVDQARWFFNSGGKVRFTSSRSGGSSTAQNTSWTNLLTSAGAQSFGANNPGVNFYNLTLSNQIFFTTTASNPYASNRYRIEARSNVANNTSGGATILTFTISWLDPYVDPPGANPGAHPPSDNVDGTLTLAVDEIRAAGNLQPSGTFTITRPTYSITAITGS
jgi:hypothetical protein